jgi:hypothetical protein
MTTLTNEVATLKVKVANLEADKNTYATKQELKKTESDLQNAIDKIAENVKAAIDKLREFVINALAELRKLIRGEDLEPRVKDLEGRMTGVEKVANAASNLAINLRIRVEKIEALLFGNADPFGIGGLIRRIESLEGGLGQALQDIKYILNYLTNFKKEFDSFKWWTERKFEALAFLLLLKEFLLLLKDKFDKILALIDKVAKILKLINELKDLFDKFKRDQRKLPERGRDGRDGKNGRDGKDGRNGTNGKDGKAGQPGLSLPGKPGTPGRQGPAGRDGRPGRDGKDGKGIDINLEAKLEAKITAKLEAKLSAKLELQVRVLIARLVINIGGGRDGRDGKNGRDGKDAEVKFSKVSVTIFDGCDASGNPKYRSEVIDAIRGTESQTAKEFLEIAKIRAQECQKSTDCPIPMHIGELYEHLPVSNQLVLEFAQKDDPKRSRWHLAVPAPRPCDTYDWCRDFQPLVRTMGNVAARITWKNHTMKTAAWCDTEQNAEEFMNKLINLSTLEPVVNADGKSIRITKNGSPRRKPRNREIRCVRAVFVTMGSDGEASEVKVMLPPPNGC